MDIRLILGITTILITLALAAYVFYRDPRSKVAGSFLTLIISFGIWAFCQTYMYVTNDLNLALLADRLTYPTGLLIAWSYLYFAHIFPYADRAVNNKIVVIAILLSVVSMILILIPDGIVQSIYMLNGVKAFRLHLIYFTVYVLAFFFIFSYALYIFLQKYRRATGEARIQLKYVVLSSLPAIITGSLFNIIFLYFDIFQYQIYAPTFTLFFSTTVFYLIFIRSRFN